MRKITAALALLLWPSGIVAEPAVQGWSTAVFRVSCLDHPFLRISAFTLRWKGVPPVDMRLTDPQGRTAGSGSHELILPKTRYGQTAEIARRPETTKALHLEVCDATEGRYVLKITEYGSIGYFLNVGADDGKVAYLGPTLLFHPSPGRTCEYNFRFIRYGSRVGIQWLDSEGRALGAGERPECKPVLKA